MSQFIEFAGNHPLLVGGFLVAVVLLIISEVARHFRGYQEIGPALAVGRINREDHVVVDISSAADFNKGHILGAKHLPMSQITGGGPEVDKLVEKAVLVVCKNGQTAHQAAARLVKKGGKDVAVLKGGMVQWQADNYPLSKS